MKLTPELDKQVLQSAGYDMRLTDWDDDSFEKRERIIKRSMTAREKALWPKYLRQLGEDIGDLDGATYAEFRDDFMPRLKANAATSGR